MSNTSEPLGNQSALAHYFGERNIEAGIAEGYRDLLQQVHDGSTFEAIPVAISYGTDYGNYPREESDTVFALLSANYPFFNSIVTVEDVDLTGEPSKDDQTTTRTLQLVAPRIITMSGALFVPNSSISDIKAVDSFTLGSNEQTRNRLDGSVGELDDTDVFMYDHTVAVGEGAIVGKILDRLSRESVEENLGTLNALRKLLLLSGLTLTKSDSTKALNQAMYDALKFTESVKKLKQS